MKLSGGPASMNLKIVLLIIAIFISVSTLIYTQLLVEKLQVRERQIVELYARGLKYVANSTSTDGDYTFLLDNIIQRIDFPLILTNANSQVPFSSIKRNVKNLEIDSTLTPGQQELFILNTINDLASLNEPIDITLQDTLILSKIYYGESHLVRQLRTYPFFQIIFAVIFILIAYVSFSYLKKTEQSNIWVGMAKETAHQLGTPISSLMGWYEYLKLSYLDPDKVLDISEEINSDLSRLNKVAQRFSKIGSTPELKKKNLYFILDNVVNYFQRRLPQSSKNVSINLIGNKEIEVDLNAELFEWVIENLIKNALDAMGSKSGKIDIVISQNDKYVEIDVSDTGKGIDIKRRKDVFRPGYSTKRRGWGLGLSLSKRIIKDYHKGKIVVKNSVPGEGTTFQILLKNIS
ncbi:MAG: HAMP domain-containing histidine kinase [Melioribacteraceae bacterium]|nr:HAMP domain-containing histidine kinase [Melioribacteraceae bacterium]